LEIKIGKYGTREIMSDDERVQIEEFINRAKDLLKYIENNKAVSEAVGYRVYALLDLKVKELEENGEI